MHLVLFLIFGLIVGIIARALVPGDQKMGMLATSILGIVGSLSGGILGSLFFGHRWDEPVAAGWIGSVLMSVVLLAVFTTATRKKA